MKVKVIATINIEDIIEVDNKYLSVSEYSRKNNDAPYLGIDDATDELVALSEQCADFCTDILAEKYGNALHYHSVSVYDLHDNVIFEEQEKGML